MENTDLWSSVEKQCLEHAIKILEKETAPTEKEIEAVKGYIAVAKEIELIKLHWAGISRVTARSDRAVNRFFARSFRKFFVIRL